MQVPVKINGMRLRKAGWARVWGARRQRCPTRRRRDGGGPQEAGWRTLPGPAVAGTLWAAPQGAVPGLPHAVSPTLCPSPRCAPGSVPSPNQGCYLCSSWTDGFVLGKRKGGHRRGSAPPPPRPRSLMFKGLHREEGTRPRGASLMRKVSDWPAPSAVSTHPISSGRVPEAT